MFLRVNGHLSHVMLTGDPSSPALVLLHSLGTCAQVWEAQVQALGQSHFIICPDFRGHGLSEESKDSLTIEALAEDVLAVLQALRIDEFHLAGISIGGLVAQTVAAKAGTRVKSLCLFDTTLASPVPKLWSDRALAVREYGLASVFDAVFGRWIPASESQTVETAGLWQMLHRTTDAAYAAGCDALAAADCRAIASQITTRTIVAVGTEDQATPPALAEILTAALADARLEQIEGAAHIPLFSHADRVNAILKSALLF